MKFGSPDVFFIQPESDMLTAPHMLCGICQAEMESLLDEQFHKQYFFCPDCEWIALSPDFFPPPEQEQAEYLQHDNRMENSGYVNMFKRLIDYLDELGCFMRQDSKDANPSAKPRALEYGCGHGPVLARLLSDLGYQVDLYDKFFYPDPVYKNQVYNLITATEVIEHIADPVQMMQLCSDLVAPQGYIALTTLLHPGPQEFFKWWYRRESSHISFFSRRTFEELALQVGLELKAENGRDTIVFAKSLHKSAIIEGLFV